MSQHGCVGVNASYLNEPEFQLQFRLLGVRRGRPLALPPASRGRGEMGGNRTGTARAAAGATPTDPPTAGPLPTAVAWDPAPPRGRSRGSRAAGGDIRIRGESPKRTAKRPIPSASGLRVLRPGSVAGRESGSDGRYA